MSRKFCVGFVLFPGFFMIHHRSFASQRFDLDFHFGRTRIIPQSITSQAIFFFSSFLLKVALFLQLMLSPSALPKKKKRLPSSSSKQVHHYSPVMPQNSSLATRIQSLFPLNGISLFSAASQATLSELLPVGTIGLNT